MAGTCPSVPRPGWRESGVGAASHTRLPRPAGIDHGHGDGDRLPGHRGAACRPDRRRRALVSFARRDSAEQELGGAMLVTELDTPAFVVDLDVLERNVSQMADHARAHGVAL